MKLSEITTEIMSEIKSLYYGGKSDIALARRYGITPERIIAIAEDRFTVIEAKKVVFDDNLRYCQYCGVIVSLRMKFCKECSMVRNREVAREKSNRHKDDIYRRSITVSF